jgi:hypothetical protein
MSDIVERLRALTGLAAQDPSWTGAVIDALADLHHNAADEIERLRALIAAIDARHCSEEVFGGGYWLDCFGCGHPWPCPDHLLIHPEGSE